ncbi:Set1C complex subunit Swd1 [Schizosaccharomyces japonicus yFS275]|uniref:Set1C complex subunit Swd1 n=1 Tax=Schizosaccharomyces japonicus (strain yFS275 / FY16936) TaxID=402676 RepID=B6K146_SCHJY|nr:Set1C complex subunit Swd1 [Schizosaccharomyces japonicus yFS275]EEB07667.1 Set1C complex subunit Swd1 [Schizosaccharomyces japonicus yFS275]
MNLGLIDPFSISDYPESLGNVLKKGHATSIRFNEKGSALAAGLVNGTVFVWNLVTLSVIRKLKGHTRAIQSVRWSSCGRYLLTASRDWKCILWDLKDATIVYSIRFQGPLWQAELHPSDINKFVVSIYEELPQFVIVRDGKPERYPLPTDSSAIISSTDTKKKRNSKLKHVTVSCVFLSNGKYVLAGTSKGWLNVIDTETQNIIACQRIASQTIKQIRLSVCKRYAIVNCTDRVIRTLSIQDFNHLEVEHKFQDVVNKLQWNACGFSPTGEYVLATAYQAAHAIYIWERSMGSLVRILEGPKEELVDVDWHPVFPRIAAVGLDTGSIYIWSAKQEESWSAFAPDFQELKENIDYEEKEDEFDIYDEDLVTNTEQEDQSQAVTLTLGDKLETQYLVPLSLTTTNSSDASSYQDD